MRGRFRISSTYRTRWDAFRGEKTGVITGQDPRVCQCESTLQLRERVAVLPSPQGLPHRKHQLIKYNVMTPALQQWCTAVRDSSWLRSLPFWLNSAACCDATVAHSRLLKEFDWISSGSTDANKVEAAHFSILPYQFIKHLPREYCRTAVRIARKPRSAATREGVT